LSGRRGNYSFTGGQALQFALCSPGYLLTRATLAKKQLVANALIPDEEGRIFVQRRVLEALDVLAARRTPRET